MLWVLFLASVLLFTGCSGSDGASPASSNEDDDLGMAVGFDRQGGYVVFDGSGAASFEVVETTHPVLGFFGPNLDETLVAYTELQALSDEGRASILLKAARGLTLDDLVPSGRLIVEREGEVSVVSAEGEFATFASWSPLDPQLLAYTYSAFQGERGYAIVDVTDGSRVAGGRGDFSAAYLRWSEDGAWIGVYGGTESDSGDDTEDEGYERPRQSFVAINAQTGAWAGGEAQDISFGAVSPSLDDRGMEIAFENGERAILSDFLGSEDVTIADSERISAHQIRRRSRRGLAFVNVAGAEMSLLAWRGDGAGAGGAPVPVATAAAVTYYIPQPKGTALSFTQVGAAFPGGGCNIFSHTSSSSMKYAIDIQHTSAAAYDQVIASAAGGTYDFHSKATANCGDASGCVAPDAYSSAYVKASTTYSSCLGGNYTCNTAKSEVGYGWGNYVILSHADGFYTMYTHLESGSTFKVVTPACLPVAAGCKLADEGHTGNTCGSVGGCGDHVHFQRQNGGSRTSTSVSISFSEDSSITSSDCTTKTPSRSMTTCSL